MKFSYWIVSAMMAAGQHATAADTNERTSPVDSNPACMDRTTDASSGDCLIKDKGRPRHTYPPPAPRGGVIATPGPVPAPSATLNKSAAGTK
jgi:hypothetical protein